MTYVEEGSASVKGDRTTLGQVLLPKVFFLLRKGSRTLTDTYLLFPLKGVLTR